MDNDSENEQVENDLLLENPEFDNLSQEMEESEKDDSLDTFI